MSKSNASADAKRGQKRFVDQPGQWRDITPKSVKARQAKDWKKLEEMMKPKKKK